MRVSIDQEGNVVVFHLFPDDKDIIHLNSSKVRLSETKARIDLGGLKIAEIHPDLIGLATILMCHQFVGEELFLPAEVSGEFLEVVKGMLSKYKICSKADSKIEKYKPPERAIPGLAFSGGADSVAALSVMPGNTVPVFMNRPIREGSIYDSDAPIRNCEILKQIGYDVKIIDCDLEYLRDPVGFPSDLAHAIPLVLMAEKLGIGSIAFGTVLESAYGVGHENYIDYPNGSHRRFYGTLLSAAGLEISLPVGGISEVGTSLIVESSPLGNLAQSCIRGKKNEPCLRCWKCFRKELLSVATIPGKEIDIRSMIRNSAEVQIRLSAFPISHENVVTFSLQRVEIAKYPFLRRLRDRLNMSLDLRMLDKWYSPSQELIPERYRMTVIRKISEYMQTMSEAEEEIVESWDMSEFLLSAGAKKAHSALTTSWQDF